MDSSSNYIEEMNELYENNPTELMQGLDEGLIQYADAVNELEDKVEEYKSAVDQFQRGEISRHTLKEEMYEFASLREEIGEIEDTVMNYEVDAETSFEQIGDDPSQIASMISESVISRHRIEEERGEQPEVLEGILPASIRGVRDQIWDKQNEVVGMAFEYESDFLERNFMTLEDGVREHRDPNEQAELNQFKDAEKAEEVMKNPNDNYLGFAQSEGTDSMEDVIETVRDQTPRGMTENELDEEEIERNNQDIEEAKERIQEKESLRYIQ